MKQNAKLSLSVAREPLEKYGLQQVIMLCMDADGVHHIVTYGKDKEQCKEAGLSGDRLKKLIGWPDNTLSRYAKDQQIEISKLKAIIQRLGGMMLSAKRENTDEWMQHLVEMTNQACEDIGDDSRFLYNEGLGVICHKGSRDDKPAKEENTRAITRDSIERESRLRQR